MRVTYHKEYSHALQRDMEFKVYGHSGKPVLAFPTSCGRFFQFEDNEMVEVLNDFINEGKIQLWACDGIDEETFFSADPDIYVRINRQNQYDEYISNELIPSILNDSKWNNQGDDQKIWITGCSMGAFHSANFYFRHPHHFDSLLALSGVYSTKHFFGEEMNEKIYFHSPLHYLRELNDERYLEAFRNSRLVICTGQGAFEDEMIADTHELKQVLERKSIPARVDFWGDDVNHDWDWWRKQLRYYVSEWM